MLLGRAHERRGHGLAVERGVLGECHVDEPEVISVLHDVDGPLPGKVEVWQKRCRKVRDAVLVCLVGCHQLRLGGTVRD